MYSELLFLKEVPGLEEILIFKKGSIKYLMWSSSICDTVLVEIHLYTV